MLSRLGIEFFLSTGLYGKRRMTHLAVHKMAPGWFAFAVASWTLEVSWGRTTA